MMRQWFSFSTLTLLFGAVLALSSLPAMAGDAAPVLGEPAPLFTLSDYQGNELSLSDLTGKVVVLEWLNCECPFVKRHYQEKTMKTLAEKYADQDVVWVSINSGVNASNEAHQQWAQEHGLSYSILQDSDGAVGRAYGAKTTPHMFIVDASGNLVYDGAIDNDQFGNLEEGQINYVDQALQELLEGKEITHAKTKPYGCSVKYSS